MGLRGMRVSALGCNWFDGLGLSGALLWSLGSCLGSAVSRLCAPPYGGIAELMKGLGWFCIERAGWMSSAVQRSSVGGACTEGWILCGCSLVFFWFNFRV